jgi:hypothetical protein
MMMVMMKGWGILGIDSQDEWLEVFVPVWTTTPFMGRHLRGMITEEAARAVGSAAPTRGQNSK